jgi:hypothetical protein
VNWRLLTWKDIAGFVLVVGFFVAAFVAFFSYADFSGRSRTPLGFGPDWSCTYQAKGDPVCVKKAVAPK